MAGFLKSSGLATFMLAVTIIAAGCSPTAISTNEKLPATTKSVNFGGMKVTVFQAPT